MKKPGESKDYSFRFLFPMPVSKCSDVSVASRLLGSVSLTSEPSMRWDIVQVFI